MNPQPSPSLLVVVPRAELAACRRLQQALDGSGIRVVLDRRASEPGSRLDAAPAASPREERRAPGDRSSALAAGRWIIVPREIEHVDVLDIDARAILFLYCSQHAVPCERCQETYRLGWVVRTERGLACPRCNDDLTSIVVAHAVGCPNWDHRRLGAIKPPARVAAPPPSRRAAAS
ncbi:MAG TPA: hypothetical protein VHZ49_07330 [Methylomirabilota bacterium]|jgi:hypothetical protein|nr:hypothetical protein [Methylomirabilota bacterium]